MTKVTVAEFKNHLSEYLRRVEEGEEVIICRRDQSIVRLTPHPESRKRLSDVNGWLSDADYEQFVGSMNELRNQGPSNPFTA